MLLFTDDIIINTKSKRIYKLPEIMNLASSMDERSVQKNLIYFYIPAINNQKMKFYKNTIYNSTPQTFKNHGNKFNERCKRLLPLKL